MAKSKVQFQKGYSLFDFFKDYGTEAQCENALLAWRFPNGFICPECANKTCCQGEIVNILLKIKNSFLPTKQILIGL
ncbi:transposase, partial [Aeromonas caviae]